MTPVFGVRADAVWPLKSVLVPAEVLHLCVSSALEHRLPESPFWSRVLQLVPWLPAPTFSKKKKKKRSPLPLSSVSLTPPSPAMFCFPFPALSCLIGVELGRKPLLSLVAGDGETPRAPVGSSFPSHYKECVPVKRCRGAGLVLKGQRQKRIQYNLNQNPNLANASWVQYSSGLLGACLQNEH